MGSCLCKEKKAKASRTAGSGDESYIRRTRGGGCRGNQTDPNDKRVGGGGSITGRSSETLNEENLVPVGGVTESSNIPIGSSRQPVRRLSSQGE